MSFNYQVWLEIEAESIRDIKKDVSSIKTSSIVKKTEGVSFFTVSLSTIRENNYILSPEYYDTEKQLENICKEIDKKANLNGHICPHCGRDETADGIEFERIRRITGYLVGTLNRFNNAKRAEVEDRLIHT